MADELRRAHFSALERTVAARRGELVKNLGDGLMVVYASAADGVDGAVAMQQAVDRHNQRAGAEPLGLRIGSIGDLELKGLPEPVAAWRRWDEAQRHFESALALETRIGSRPLVARTSYSYARMLLERDGQGDRARAGELLAEAIAVAGALGMSRLLAQCHELRKEPDGRV